MRQPARRPNQQRSELAEALAACRGAFISIGLMSGMSNILMLTGAIFMLEVYDRVLPSRSVPTLIGLVMLAAGLFTAQGLLDLIRGRMLVRVGTRLDEALSGRVYETVVRLPLKVGNRSDGLQPLRDLDSIRSFLSGLGPTALFDLPWLPIYLAICFMFHPYIGLAALVGAIILGIITMMTETMTREPTRAATTYAMARTSLAEASRRNAEVLTAMGMTSRIAAQWGEANTKYLASQRRASDVAGGFGSASKVLRMMLQSGVLAVGAYLVIYQQATAGIIIAGSILSARALAPVDLAIANWRGFVGARQGWQRLTDLLTLLPAQAEPMPLQPPSNSITIENVGVIPPGSEKAVVQDVSLSLKAGSGLGIIGPSGSGKSSLARLLVGVWRPARGRIRLDGAALDQWSPDSLGRHVGYLPQDVELLAGTVAQNIGRFSEPLDAKAVIAAATAAGVHDLIVGLPEGYETQVGESGAALSAGQAQRVALARALYGDPFLVVLDEPNSNLDAEGDEALGKAILGIRNRGGIVVVVAHRPSAIASVDMLLMMAHGRTQAFGPRDEVLARVLQRDNASASRSLKVVQEAGAASS
ncbi:MAG TPA: type I secretion system permease/ATPase [Bradyrhizobium sp.]|nr:type I secretion system permease/ATPase [Bradyrhizobium sp.]